jgi:hypothetical protein
VEVSELVASLVDIETAAHEFINHPESGTADEQLLKALRQHHGRLNEPYGFDRDTDALRNRVWKDCMTILSNLELAPRHAAGQQSELVRSQVQKLATMIEGLLDRVRQRMEKH